MPDHPAGPGRSHRRLVPPTEKAKRRRFYGLMGAAKNAQGAQRAHLLQLARGLMVWVEVEAEEGAGARTLPPATVYGRPRPRRRP